MKLLNYAYIQVLKGQKTLKIFNKIIQINKKREASGYTIVLVLIFSI